MPHLTAMLRFGACLPQRRLAIAWLAIALLALSSLRPLPAQAAWASASATVLPYWRVDRLLSDEYLPASLIMAPVPARASVLLTPTTLTPPQPNYVALNQGWAAAYADPMQGQLGAGASIRYGDQPGNAQAGATVDSGPVGFRGGRAISLLGLPYIYLGRLRLTLHGHFDGMAGGTLGVSGSGVAGGSLGIRSDAFGDAQVSCGFAVSGSFSSVGCREKVRADLSGDRLYTNATWDGGVGRVFNLTMDMPLLVSTGREQFSLRLTLDASASTSQSLLDGATIDMLNTSRLSIVPDAGVTLRYDPLFLSAVDEPAVSMLVLPGLLLVGLAARRRHPGLADLGSWARGAPLTVPRALHRRLRTGCPHDPDPRPW